MERFDGSGVNKMLFAKWHKPLYYGCMNATVTMDKAGRIVLPKAIRDELHLSPGETLDLLVEGGQLMLRPKLNSPPLRKERGVWIFRSGARLSASQTRETLHQLREGRVRQGLGDSQ